MANMSRCVPGRRLATGVLALVAALALALMSGAASLSALAATPGVRAGAALDKPPQSGPAQLLLTPAAQALFAGQSTVVTLTLNNASRLYGYQVRVNYDAGRVSASAEFLNGLLDTSAQAFVPGGWNAACAAGVCRFAVTKLSPAAAVSGSGAIARITFTGLAAGAVPLSFSTDLLGNRDGEAIAHTSTGGLLTVYGTATITGVVSLQGRVTPISSGAVVLTDTAGLFTPTVAAFDAATGAFAATVPVDLNGSVYNLRAMHSLYLSSQLTGLAVTAGGSFSAGSTMLLGGDATDDGVVNIFDLTCMGGAYGGPATVCGAAGSSDINADGVVNILDLVLAGGNYGLAAPRPW